MPNVQIRGVPEDVHRRLKAQAAANGQSLNEYLLGHLTELAGSLSLAELVAEMRQKPAYTGPSSASIIRRARGPL